MLIKTYTSFAITAAAPRISWLDSTHRMRPTLARPATRTAIAPSTRPTSTNGTPSTPDTFATAFAAGRTASIDALLKDIDTHAAR